MEYPNAHKNKGHDHHEIEVLTISNDTKISSKRFSCDPICRFSKHGLEHEDRSKSATKVLGAMWLCILFMVVEIIGGVKANSLAVLTDAAHMLTDIAGFAFSLLSIWISGWDATPHRSYGFFRIEVLGALLSIQLIWLIAGVLIYQAIDRIHRENHMINGKLMFVTAAFGFFVNLIMVLWLGHDHYDHAHCGKAHQHGEHHSASCGSKKVVQASDQEKAILLSSSPMCQYEISDTHQHKDDICEQSTGDDPDGGLTESHVIQITGQTKMSQKNMNVQSAYLHVICDLIQSVGVMIGGAIIWVRPTWVMVDLICTLGFSILAVCTTVSMLRSILDILMESTPNEIDVVMLETGIRGIDGVYGVHDLHVWSISTGKILLSCHATVDRDADSNRILINIADYCEETYRINHVTIQIEKEETAI